MLHPRSFAVGLSVLTILKPATSQRTAPRAVVPVPAATVGMYSLSKICLSTYPELMRHRSEDHIARECDQPRNPDTIQCRNCDESK